MEPLPPAPKHISPALFSQFRRPRRGLANPEVMTNPVWAWLVEEGHNAFIANEIFGGPDSLTAGPCWTFARNGRTETALPDGRVIRIGGEHEDFYDADFYIYNDAVVTDTAGGIEIFGYPEDIFPPTDFHAATLVGDQIILTGNLSYAAFRKDKAQVALFDTARCRFEILAPDGAIPPWLHRHSAELVGNGSALLIRGGLIADPRTSGLEENIDDWRLDIHRWRWERLTHRDWPRFAFRREDGRSHHLAQMGWLAWSGEMQRRNREGVDLFRHLEQMAELTKELGAAPRLDVLATLYVPDIPHVKIPDVEDEFEVHRIGVDGVTVRYVRNVDSVGLTVEGDLPADIVERLRADFLEKLTLIENAPIACTRLPLPRR